MIVSFSEDSNQLSLKGPEDQLQKLRLIKRPDWTKYFMAIAKVISTRSTCSSRPVGCVITTSDNRILVTGYNGAPPGEVHCTDLSSDSRAFCARRQAKVPDALKHQGCRSLHAEENALSLAQKLGLEKLLIGATIYTTLSPCIRCVERLKSLGVKKVYFELAYSSVDPNRDLIWHQKALEAFEVFEQTSLDVPELKKIVGSLIGTTSERLLPSV
jgi:dCMP deaminase